MPLSNPTATFYLDDSGTKSQGGKLLVIAGIKIRRHGQLMGAIRHVRDQTGFQREFHFTGINQGSISAYYELINQLEKSDARLVASVVNPSTWPKQPAWRMHAEVNAQLVRGNTNRGELVSAFMDCISTPPEVPFEDVVRGMVNKELGRAAVIGSACLDSKSSDGLQMADLIASAIGFDRRRLAGESGKASSMKGRVVTRLKAAFGLEDFVDGRSDRSNIVTYQPRQLRLRSLPTGREAV